MSKYQNGYPMQNALDKVNAYMRASLPNVSYGITLISELTEQDILIRMNTNSADKEFEHIEFLYNPQTHQLRADCEMKVIEMLRKYCREPFNISLRVVNKFDYIVAEVGITKDLLNNIDNIPDLVIEAGECPKGGYIALILKDENEENDQYLKYDGTNYVFQADVNP